MQPRPNKLFYRDPLGKLRKKRNINSWHRMRNADSAFGFAVSTIAQFVCRAAFTLGVAGFAKLCLKFPFELSFFGFGRVSWWVLWYSWDLPQSFSFSFQFQLRCFLYDLPQVISLIFCYVLLEIFFKQKTGWVWKHFEIFSCKQD